MAGRLPARGACALLVAAALGAACRDDAPRTAPPAPPPAATAAAPEPAPPPRLDAFGNLRAAERRILGFPVPVAHDYLTDGARGPVIYVPATEERLVRFYRSRGHVPLKQLVGYRFEHNARTLRGLDDAEAVRSAFIIARQGPGPGWTLSFDPGTPVELAQPPLLELVEAERAAALGEAPEAAPAAAPAAREGRDGELLALDGGGAAAGGAAAGGTAPGGGGAAGGAAAGGPTAEELRALRARLIAEEQARRAAAAREGRPARSRDVSERVLEAVKADPRRGFLD